MKYYQKVFQFTYKGKSYNMYLDNHNKHFFLRNNVDGSLSYITIEELIDLSLCFINVPLVMNARKGSKKGMVPKVIIGGVSVTLSLTLLSTFMFSTFNEMRKSEERIRAFEESRINSTQSVEEDLKDYLSYDEPTPESTEKPEESKPGLDFIKTPPDELVVDTYLESDWLSYKFIYDMEYLDKVFDYDNVSIDQVKSRIQGNNHISEKFKNLLYEYCDSLISKYPNIELRVLYENLKTLEVVECDKLELVRHSLSMDSYGCYVRSENKIYVLKDYDYVKGTWPYQVIFHEFNHCLRTGDWIINDTRIKVQVEGQNFSNTITAEALNSLFTVSLFDYDELDIAYQLQSNYHKIMIECMDNYTLEDYVNHSVSYYASKLDEFNQDDNYATTILELIQAQYTDYHNDSISVSQEEYYPIYDYVADMYFRKNINSNMSYSDAVNVADQLITKIMYDVPEDYNIDINHFYEYLDSYCEKLGIETSKARS